MASAQNLISDWTGDEGERHVLYGSKKAMIVRWLNQSQLRFVDKSECLQGVWQPTLTSDGSATLPDDFLHAFKDRVEWTEDEFLTEGDYAILNGISISGTDFYCIFDGKFYVFTPAAGTPTIPYVKKPAEITVSNITTAYLDIPDEYHHILIYYMDAMNFRRKDMLDKSLEYLAIFDRMATQAGTEFHKRRDRVPMMRGRAL